MGGRRGWRADVRARRPCRARRWAAWRGRTRLARWLAWEHAGTAASLARAEAGVACFAAARRCAAAAAPAPEEEGRGGSYIRLCRAMDQGAAVPRQERWRGRAMPRQRSALLVAATSALCRASMHGAAQAFGHVRAIGAAKSVSLKKIVSVRFKIILKKGLKLKKILGASATTYAAPCFLAIA